MPNETYVVIGRWPFPIDMLRRDRSEPATTKDADLIAMLSSDTIVDEMTTGPHTIVLRAKDRFGRLGVAVERWKSFQWNVIEDHEHVSRWIEELA